MGTESYKEINDSLSLCNHTDDDGEIEFNVSTQRYEQLNFSYYIDRDESVDVIQHLMSIYNIHKDEL